MTTLEKATQLSEKIEGKIKALKIKHEQLQKKISTLVRMGEALDGNGIKRITVIIADKDDETKDAGFGLKPEEFPELVRDITALIQKHRAQAEDNLKKFLEQET